MDAKSEEWYSTAKPGDTVARGPRWPLGNMMDGGLGGLGKVIGINKSEMTVMVQWDVTGQQDKFKMGAVAGLPAYSVENSAPASVDDLLVRALFLTDLLCCCRFDALCLLLSSSRYQGIGKMNSTVQFVGTGS